MIAPQDDDGVVRVVRTLERLDDLADEVIHHGRAREVGLDGRLPLICRPDPFQPRIMCHPGMGRGHIIEVVFPVAFRKLDLFQGESIKVFLGRVVG